MNSYVKSMAWADELSGEPAGRWPAGPETGRIGSKWPGSSSIEAFFDPSFDAFDLVALVYRAPTLNTNVRGPDDGAVVSRPHGDEAC